MNYKVNTVIIGGGPSGTACGNYLQAKGISNIIIEKRTFPREKLCAGLVTTKTYRMIGKIWDLQHPGEALPEDLFCSETHDVRFYCANKLLIHARTSDPFRFVHRSHFDHFLAMLYTESGGTLLQNSYCKDYDFQTNTLKLQNGDTVTYQHLIAADGAFSRTRKALGIHRPILGFCIETRIPNRKHSKYAPVRAYFGTIENGYVWIFPSGNELCVGLGSVYKKGVDYCAMFERFLKMNHIHAPRNTWKGAFVPYGECINQRDNPPDVVLIGDAGGFVDPFNGEGLYFALCTGNLAAQSIIRCEKNSTTLCSEFVKATSRYAKTIHQARIMQKPMLSRKFWSLTKNIFRNQSKYAG